MHFLGVDIWTGFWTLVAWAVVGIPFKNGVLWVWGKITGKKSEAAS